jgi:hypothetical protein
MVMGRVYGGHRGYEFPRQACAGCGKRVAVSIQPDGRNVWLRRHNTQPGVPCGAPRLQRRVDR